MNNLADHANNLLTDPGHAESPTGERRDIRTRFQPGHTLSMKHGGRSKRVAALELPEQAEARAALRERVASILVDLGGVESLSTLAVGLAERHA
jgi:hypothetical protein